MAASAEPAPGPAGQINVYQIPVCPFCQRLQVVLALKDAAADVNFIVIDVTKERPQWLLERTRGTTSLPVLETADGKIIKESLVIMQYLDDVIRPERPVRARDPYKRAVEGMLTALEGAFTGAGYRFVMNQDEGQRGAFADNMDAQYRALDAFLQQHASREGPFLHGNAFGWAEAVFVPLFKRFAFLAYYEDYEAPVELKRVCEWRDACLAHPAAQQTSDEEVIKLYYDYAKGAGNGKILPGRKVSSFAPVPQWNTRPWPPKGRENKYKHAATDAELGLLGTVE